MTKNHRLLIEARTRIRRAIACVTAAYNTKPEYKLAAEESISALNRAHDFVEELLAEEEDETPETT